MVSTGRRRKSRDRMMVVMGLLARSNKGRTCRWTCWGTQAMSIAPRLGRFLLPRKLLGHRPDSSLRPIQFSFRRLLET
ncbi:unnamed protein product [Victoria cruziana]